MIDEFDGSRWQESDFVLSEREMVERWLDFHRMTLLECEGIDDESSGGKEMDDVSSAASNSLGGDRDVGSVYEGQFSGRGR